MAEESARLNEQVLIEALITGRDILNTIDTADPTTLAAFDRIQAFAEREQLSWLIASERAGEPVTATSLAIHLYSLLLHWFEGGAVALTYVRFLLNLSDFDTDLYADRIVIQLLAALEPLATLQVDATYEAQTLLTESVAGFSELAHTLAAAGHQRLAFNCANICCNLIGAPDDPPFLVSAEYALTLAQGLDHELVGVSLVRVAVATVAAVQRGDRSLLAAFDALERAVRYLPLLSAQRDYVFTLLSTAINQPAYASLRILLSLSLPVEKRPALPAEFGDLGLMLVSVAEVELEPWLRATEHFTELAIEIENQRLALQPASQTDRVVADWSTWMFRHQAYHRAIPDSGSLLREHNLPELILVLNHELTHIFSMASQIGIAINALRIAALDVELNLWSFLWNNDSIDAAQLLQRGVAPLTEATVIALPQAEQALEISRKMQIIRECWEPWFEGIAVFAELATDPTQDPYSYSPMIEVLTQLVDVTPERPETMTPDERRQWAAAHMGKLEQLYADAVQQVGPYRLRAYLDRPDHYYLAGYLAVRAVVAAWRQTLDRPLSGAQAARILLHITRYGASETIPNLALPLTTFSSEVQRRVVAWVQQVATIRRADLERVLSDYFTKTDEQTSLAWREGRLVPISTDKTSYQEVEAQIATLVAQAVSSLTGSNADLERVPGANPECRMAMAAAAQSLLNAKPNQALVELLTLQYLYPQSVLPLGEVEAPFWLHRGKRLVFCLIRTTEGSAAHNARHRPGYNGIYFSLEPEKFAALEAEVRTRHLTRMTITRMADLAYASVDEDGRGFGRNYVAFRYGNWLHIQPRGLWTGTTEVAPSLYAAVEARVMPNPLVILDAEVIADGAAGAERTRQWIASLERWEVAGATLPIDEWASYVAALAASVLDASARGERLAISQALLQLIFDDAQVVETVQRLGLRGLWGGDRLQTQALVRFLDASARMPVAQPPPPVTAGQLVRQTPYGWDVAPPVGYRSQGESEDASQSHC